MTESLLEMINLQKSIELKWPRLLGATHASKKALVLSDVSLKIRKGESYGIVGLPGSGKSLLVNMILKKSTPTAGKILLEGKDISAIDPETLGQSIKTILFEQNRIPPSPTGLGSDHKLLIIGENFAQLPEKDQRETLKNLRKNRNRSLLFVQDNLRATAYAYKRLAIMYRGKIVEKNATMPGDRSVSSHLFHPFSQNLWEYNKENKWPQGNLPVLDPFEKIPGCGYFTVCPLYMDICREREPRFEFVDRGESPDIGVACFAFSSEAL